MKHETITIGNYLHVIQEQFCTMVKNQLRTNGQLLKTSDNEEHIKYMQNSSLMIASSVSKVLSWVPYSLMNKKSIEQISRDINENASLKNSVCDLLLRGFISINALETCSPDFKITPELVSRIFQSSLDPTSTCKSILLSQENSNRLFHFEQDKVQNELALDKFFIYVILLVVSLNTYGVTLSDFTA